MAGGINLPNIGVGVGPVMGAMQFQPMAQDPFTTMLKAYAIGQQGNQMGIESLANAKKMPYIEPQAQASIAQALAAAEHSRAGADSQRASARLNSMNADIAKRKEDWYLENGAITPAQREALDAKAKYQALAEVMNQMNMQQQDLQAFADVNMPSYAPGYQPEGIATQVSQGLDQPASFSFLPAQNMGMNAINPNTYLQNEMLKLIDPSAYKAKEAGMIEKAKQNEKAWTKTADLIASESDAASNLIGSLEVADANYQQLNKYQRGPGLGMLPAVTKEAQELDRVVSGIILTNMQAIKGNASDKDVERIEKAVLGRNLSPEAWAEAQYMTKALAERTVEKQQFMQAARERGISSMDANSRWSEYVKKNSLYDKYRADKERFEQLRGM